MPKELRYHYNIRIPYLYKESEGVDAYTEQEAIRKLVFRRKLPSKTLVDNVALASEIFETSAYQVIDHTPIYSDHFDPEKEPDWATSRIENIKKGLQ